MSNSFSSSLWMLPFSKNCRDHSSEKDVGDDIDDKGRGLRCDAHEYATNASGWPVHIAKVNMPTLPGSGVYQGFFAEEETPGQSGECSIPIQRSFSAHEVSDGTFFREIGDFEPDSERALHQLNKYYLNDPILNPLTPWERPPIRNVYCIYGINLKTEVGYHFAPSGKSYPDNWIITDIIYEVEGGSLLSRSGSNVDGNPGPTSGDNTVPYNSLSWCKTWLGPRVNITRTPQNAHYGSDVQEILDVEQEPGKDIFLKMPHNIKSKYITYYEDGTSLPGKKTAVWELDKLDHRNLVRSPVLMREMWLETLHSLHPEPNKHFVSKAMRKPMRDEDCYWDYSKARCSFLRFCEYRYIFGDVHLGQSCRLKASSHG
ncbi:hypothetical protein O6H91_Y288800 [Diphasiastrum complanatum]|nr:hypothetical protein O6H91_Y288800 [Diphasiastrum complanatum]